MAHKIFVRSFVLIFTIMASIVSYAGDFWLNREFIGTDTVSQQVCKLKTPAQVDKSIWGDKIEVWLTLGDSAPRKYILHHTPFSSHKEFYREITRRNDYKNSSELVIQDASDRYLFTFLVHDKEQRVSLGMRHTGSSINGFDVDIQNSGYRQFNCVDMK